MLTLTRALPALSLALLAAACGDDRGDDDDAGIRDAGAGDAAIADAGLDAGAGDAGPQRCEDALREARFALDPDGPRTQIHPVARWDGEAIWVVYVRPEPGGGNFDVWATRVGCGGEPLVAPFLVQEAPEGNDIDPELAIAGDAMLVAWQTDDGTGGTDNLQIRYRLFDREGTPRSGDRTLHSLRMGAPITDNHMMPKLAVTPDGGFVVAGIRAVEEVGRFAAFAQPLSASGDLAGDALEPGPEMEVTQSNVAVAVTPDGTVWLTWDRQPDAGASETWMRSFGSDTSERVLDGLDTSAGSDVIATDDAVYAAFTGETAIGTDLRLVALSASPREATTVGIARRVESSPRWAQGPDGQLALAFFRQIRGFTMELLAVSVTPGSPPTAAEPVLVQGSPGVPAYQPALTHVSGDWWFLAHAEGDSPDFRLIGRFVELP